VAYSLVEKIIKLISNVGENGVNLFDEGTLTKLILQLNETIAVVLEYLEDAKEHGQRKGDDLLASVRIIGSYLAEAPLACNEKVRDLLGYMLSIEGADEQMPFQSVCFLLPMLCQITMKVEGCKALASCEGGLKAVLDCLRKLIGSKLCMVEDDSCVFLACDTIMNLLLNKDKLQLMLDESTYVDLLKALASWSENTDDMSSMMMASSICSLIFDYTSEEALLNHPDFNHGTLSSLYQLIARCMASSEQGMDTDMDLSEIIYAGFYRWAHRPAYYGEPFLAPYSPQSQYSMEFPRYEFDKHILRNRYCYGGPKFSLGSFHTLWFGFHKSILGVPNLSRDGDGIRSKKKETDDNKVKSCADECVPNKTRSNDVGSTDISVLDVMDKVNNQRSTPAKQIESDHGKVDAKGSEKRATHADVLIQAIYRGYLVRKWKPLKKLRQIAEVSKEVTYVRDRSQAFEELPTGVTAEDIIDNFTSEGLDSDMHAIKELAVAVLDENMATSEETNTSRSEVQAEIKVSYEDLEMETIKSSNSIL
ncbi:neuroguidin, partial [Trifolium pratense]